MCYMYNNHLISPTTTKITIIGPTNRKNKIKYPWFILRNYISINLSNCFVIIPMNLSKKYMEWVIKCYMRGSVRFCMLYVFVIFCNFSWVFKYFFYCFLNFLKHLGQERMQSPIYILFRLILQLKTYNHFKTRPKWVVVV